MAIELYHPEKYPVFVGTDPEAGAGLCTVWSSPEIMLQKNLSLLAHVRIMGTLQSPGGISPMLRNLALHPEVQEMLVYQDGTTSWTPDGISGINPLRQFMKSGVDDEGRIVGSRVKIDPEIDLGAIEAIRQNVVLTDVSSLSVFDLSEAAGRIRARKPYMEPVRFDDPKVDPLATFPSEEVGFLVRGKSIVEAWTRALDKVMRYGTVLGSQGAADQKEVMHLTWVIEDQAPGQIDIPQAVTDAFDITKEKIESYLPQIVLPIHDPNIAYTYGERLFAFEQNVGKLSPIDQVNGIVEEINKDPNTRRAVAVSWNPRKDMGASDPPCFIVLQALKRKGKLHFFVEFRSHDMVKAALSNAFGFRRLQEQVAVKTGSEVGTLTMDSISAHAYESTWDDANKYLDCVLRQREPRLIFSEYDADPRGNFLIRSNGTRISLELFDPASGTTFFSEEGSATKLLARIVQLGLLVDIAHAMDLARQLERAETARMLGLSYVQDRHLNLSQFIKS